MVDKIRRILFRDRCAGRSLFASLGYFAIGLVLLLSLLLPSEAYADGTWATKTSMPEPRTWAAAGVINGVLYVAGGTDGSGPINTLWSYDATANTWSTLASMPGPRDTGVGAGVIDGKLYVAGGWSGSLPTNTLFVYDPLANSWSTRASIPQGGMYYGSGHGASGVINGKLYVYTAATGYDGWWKYLHVYDPATNSWTQLPESPNYHVNPAFGVIDNKFYVAGGDDWSGNSANWKKLDVYDPATNTWTTKAPMPAGGRGFASAVLNGKLYVIGGDDGATNKNTVYVYDPATDGWTTETAMPTARAGAAVGAINGSLYIAGGANSTGTLATTEALTLAATTPPTVSTNDWYYDVTAASARVRLNIDSLGTASSVNVSFQWGTSSGNYTGETTPGNATAAPAIFDDTITGLNAGTTYYYRARAVGDGTSYGSEKSFTTLSLTPPTVTTGDVTGIGTTSATFYGNLVSMGTASSVMVGVQWGTTSGDYTGEAMWGPAFSSQTYWSPISGFSPSTTYYYRAKAVGDGTVYGLEDSFTTATPNQLPVASFTYSPTNPQAGQVVMVDASGSGDPDGAIANYSWDWGDWGSSSAVGPTGLGHTFTSAGSYLVVLTVRDNSNGTGSQAQTITVSAVGQSSSSSDSGSSFPRVRSLPDISTWALIASGLPLLGLRAIFSRRRKR
ncbi:MAG: PKD domain-containing protein [Chloroflexi bacterium]|nr:PKD domain-containing protein [Chloroflexota bacterium]